MDSSGYRIMAVLGVIAAISALFISVAALVAGDSSDDRNVAAASIGPQTIDVELSEFAVKLASSTVPPETDVTFRVHNAGAIAHDLTIESGSTTGSLNPGQTATLHVGEVKSALTVFCSVPGHRTAGMEAKLGVGATAGQSAVSATPVMDHTAMDESYLAGIKAFPAKTTGLGNVPMTPTVVNGVKVFDLTADEIDWEVAPGEVKHGMAFNSMIPGPTIHVKLGDRVRIVLHNKLEESTALHFHGLEVPNDQDGVPGITQPLVHPGETFSYEFVVQNAGSHMYHSHMNAAEQVPAGLLGAFIVDGPNEPVVTHDEVMVLNDGPLGYTINGKGFPATAPIVAKQGDTIRVRYMNEGLQIHPMHLHGITQTVIALDGNPVPQPYVQDTVLVAPGQRVDVLIKATAVGTWAYHCHILTHAETESGMYGMVTVLLVQ